MQTLHLRFRDLRAILLGQRPGRWPSPSIPRASTWKGAPPLPNLPRPTLAVGSRPGMSRQPFARCPTAGAGLPLASPFREAHGVGPYGAAMCRVCRWQPARNSPHPAAPHEAGQGVGCSLQARTSEVQGTPSFGLSFPLRPQRCGARACGEKTADPEANVGALAGVSCAAHRRRCERTLRQRLSSAGG